MPAPTDAASPIPGRHRHGKDRRQGRDRAIHQPRKPRLHPCQDELPPRAVVFGFAAFGVQVAVFQRVGGVLMTRFRRRQVAQQFAGGRVRGALGGGKVETFGVALHCGGFFAHPVKAQVLDQPDRATGVVARHVFAADQGYDLAKAVAVQGDQALAMAVLFLGHAVEHPGAVGKYRAQTLGIHAIDAGVVFFRRDRQGQDFLLAEVREPPSLGDETHGTALA